MAAPGGYSDQPTFGRKVTQKWARAKEEAVDYGGDGWGDDDYGYEESAGDTGYAARGFQGTPSHRSATNPSPSRSAGRSSFDRGDERRFFSSAGNFQGPYPTAQRSPFPEPEHDFEPVRPSSGHRHQSSMNSQPPSQSPYGQSSQTPGTRGRQFPDYDWASPASGIYPGRRSQSSNRPSTGEVFGRQESPTRPESRSSNSSRQYYPPRKSSLSHAQPSPEGFATPAETPSSMAEAAKPKADPKPLPFIRPADIYKRMEEEKEKERRSVDSSRPGLESIIPRTRAGSTGAQSFTSEGTERPNVPNEGPKDTDSARRLKVTLDPVPERKSEYGFENMFENAGVDHPSVNRPSDTANSSPPEPISASSDYSDRASAVSLPPTDPASDPPGRSEIQSQTSKPSLPAVGRFSGFGTDFLDMAAKRAGKYPDNGSLTAASDRSPASPSTIPTQSANQRDYTASEKDLQHKPSFGYRSVVQQAFEDSQAQDLVSPTSTTETLPRSNSASTSDISPIMSRKHDMDNSNQVTKVQHQTILEENTQQNSRPSSAATLKADTSTSDGEPSQFPPVIVPGYRRDGRPPSQDNSPARRPLSISTGDQALGQVGLLSNSTPITTSSYTPESDIAMASKIPLPKTPASDVGFASIVPLPETPGSAFDMSSRPPFPPLKDRKDGLPLRDLTPTNETPPEISRTTSDDYQEWQAQRKQFNAKLGINDSSSSLSIAPSPISRSETPSRGIVRDMTEKLESRSGTTTPINTAVPDHSLQVSRPAPQDRMESFRPTLPGGWQSFTTAPGVDTPQHELPKPVLPRGPWAQSRNDSTESIPTATAPRNWSRDDEGLSTKAFQAAAAAGSALADAFSGMLHSDDTPLGYRTDDTVSRSQASSDDESDPPNPPPKHWRVPDDSLVRDFAEPAPFPPTPLPKNASVSKKVAFADDVQREPPKPSNLPPLPPTPLPNGPPKPVNDAPLPLALISKDMPEATHVPPLPLSPASQDSPPSEIDIPASTLGYFPAPLRSSKSRDTTPLARPPISHIPSMASTESDVADDENTRLRQEIVKSLTPRSSGFDPDLIPAGTNDRNLIIPKGRPKVSEGPDEDDEWWDKDTPPGNLSTDSDQYKSGAASGPGNLVKRFSWEASPPPTAVAKAPGRIDKDVAGSPDFSRARSEQEQDFPDFLRAGPPSPPLHNGSLVDSSNTDVTPASVYKSLPQEEWIKPTNSPPQSRPLPVSTVSAGDSTSSTTSLPSPTSETRQGASLPGTFPPTPAALAEPTPLASQATAVMSPATNRAEPAAHSSTSSVVQASGPTVPRTPPFHSESVSSSSTPNVPSRDPSQDQIVPPLVERSAATMSSARTPSPAHSDRRQTSGAISSEVAGPISRASSLISHQPSPNAPVISGRTAAPPSTVGQAPTYATVSTVVSDSSPSRHLQTSQAQPSPSAVANGQSSAPPPPIAKDPSPVERTLQHRSSARASSMSASHVPESEPIPFRDILALSEAQQRIQAFQDAAKSYTQSDGMLTNWMQSMDTREHDDVFTSAGQTPGSIDQAHSSSPYRPSPRRDFTGASGSISIPKDGKQLLAAANKYGGKAGIAAKGLFAKGRDKLRTASASDKVAY